MPEARCQRTIGRAVKISGRGLFHGCDVRVRLLPADPGVGVVFRRVDLVGRPEVAADVRNVAPGSRRTILCCGAAVVETTEHLLAALAGMGVDNCIVELDAREVPAVDGSCLPFCEAILAAGVVTQGVKKPEPMRLPLQRIGDPDGSQWVECIPGSDFVVSYRLDYGPQSPVPAQSQAFAISPDVFLAEIAPARTFVLESEVEALQAAGYGRHLTGSDLLVFREDGSLIDNQLRWADEPVRHKILDCIGDLFLCGHEVSGRIVANRSGHRLNQLVAEVLQVHVANAETDVEGFLRVA